MFHVLVTHRPTFASPVKEALPAGSLFYGFRTRSFGRPSEVVLYDEWRHQSPATWVSREAAERNVHHLISRGYTARVVEN